MKLFKILAIAVMAMVSSASAKAGVALSNMGSNGTTYSSFIDITNQTAAVRNAVGFTVGGSDFTLGSVSAAMFGNGAAAKFAIYSDVGGNPGVVVSTSTSTNVGGDNVYSFSFVGQTGNVLTAGQTYWALVGQITPDMAWYEHTDGTAPSDVNALGLLTYLDDERSTNFNAARTWTGLASNRTFSILGTAVPPAAVPEPALTSLLCLSGIALIRRRMKK
jgi:hypothetical protein